MRRMNRPELESQLDALPSQGKLGLRYDLYADIFPPGEPDENARQECYALAKRRRCTILHDADRQTVWFQKE